MKRPAGSPLDRMIARLWAQRCALEEAARRIAAIPGPILEVGLGKGRTYGHLRALFQAREIWAFDRDLHVPRDEIAPPPERTILGELSDTLPAAAARIGAPAALIHADIGTSRPERDLALAQFVADCAPALLAPGGLVVGDRPMAHAALEPLDWAAPAPPGGIAAWPYFAWRRR